MAAAVASVDLLYATLGLAGFGQLADADGARLALGLASGAILVVIGARTAWAGFRARMGLEAAEDVVSAPRAFGTAIAATALNPLTIGLWAVSFPAAAPEAAASSSNGAAAVLTGAALGTLTWYGGVATVIALARARVGPRLLAAVDMGAGVGLVGFGGALAYRAVEDR